MQNARINTNVHDTWVSLEIMLHGNTQFVVFYQFENKKWHGYSNSIYLSNFFNCYSLRDYSAQILASDIINSIFPSRS